jgi:hypothetical protein
MVLKIKAVNCVTAFYLLLSFSCILDRLFFINSFRRFGASGLGKLAFCCFTEGSKFV